MCKSAILEVSGTTDTKCSALEIDDLNLKLSFGAEDISEPVNKSIYSCSTLSLNPQHPCKDRASLPVPSAMGHSRE